LYVCMAIKYIIVLFVETPRKFITAKLSIRKPGSSSLLIICDLIFCYLIILVRNFVIVIVIIFQNLLSLAVLLTFKN
jgi:hypothetical protein